MPWCSGPQPFWHQRLVSWKATFPQTGKGVGRETGGGAQAVMQAKRYPLLTSGCTARFLTGHGLLPVRGPEAGDPSPGGC